MPPFSLVVLVVAVTSVIQSLFGVGVLLFGTPWLLLLGLDFIPALQHLLPVSLAISLLQVARDARWIDRGMMRGVVLLTLPAIGLTLWATSIFRPRLDLLVAGIVISVALQERARWIGRGIATLLRFERAYMVFMGVVHGASNLGGGLLTGWVYSKGQHGRVARGTVATGYGMFAAVQLMTLALAPSAWQPAVQENVILTLSGAAVFVFTDRLVFPRFRAVHFRKGLELLLLATGVVLLGKVIL